MIKSAGILPFRQLSEHIEVLLVHPGGPFWAKKDDGAWSIAKGEFDLPPGMEPVFKLGLVLPIDHPCSFAEA